MNKNFPETNSQRVSNVGSNYAASNNTPMPAFQFVPQRKWFRLKPGRFVDEEDSLSQSENNGFLEDDEDNNSSTTETFGGESQSTSNDDHLFSIG